MLKKYSLNGLLKVVISMVLVATLSFTVIIPGSAVNEKVGRFGEVSGSDGNFSWTENGTKKVLNYFYVGKATLANQAYCIDHTAALNDGTVRTGTESDLLGGSDYWNRLSVEARKGVMYTLLYGYNGRDNKVPDKLKSRDLKLSTMDYLAATQFLVWEYTLGYRKNADTLSNYIFYNCIKGRRAETAYKYILEQIACHEIKASFLSKANDMASAPKYTMKWNENTGRYETVVKDKNGNSFTWEVQNGIGVSQYGSEYTFYTKEARKNFSAEIKKRAESGIMASSDTFKLVVFDGNGQSLARGKWDPLSYYMTFTTEPDGAIEITKTADDGIIENVNFTISGKNLSEPMTLATDKSGIVTFPDLKPGTYTVTEEVPDEKYVSPKPVTAEVRAGETVQLSFHNRVAEYSFKIRKYVMDTEYSPDCATFTFKITGENLTEPVYATTYWTDTWGDIQIGETTVIMPGPGIYTVEEVETGGKYTAEFLMRDYLEVKSDGHNGSIWVKNTPNKGTLKIKKTSEDFLFHGVTFTISGENLSEPITVATDSNGEIAKELVVGTYTITENTDNKYYPQGSQTVTVTADTVTEVSFHNRVKRGDLKIIKTSDTGIVEGKVFRISSLDTDLFALADGTEVMYIDLVTDKDGIAVAEDIPFGRYEILEIDISAAYKDFEAVEITLENEDAVTTVYMHNELRTGNVVIQKTAEDGVYEGHKFLIHGKVFDPEGDSEFAVKDFSAEMVTDAEGFASLRVPVNVISENGKVYRADEAGFTIVEIAQDKYEKLSPITGMENQVANGGPIKLNNILKKGNVKVIKNSEDGVVEGISFTLSGTSFFGQAVSVTSITDENGELLFENLVPSDEKGYTIVENNVPDYYISPEPVVVQVVAEETAVAEFENLLKKGTVKVVKTSEDGMVEGITFLLKGTSASGQAVELRTVTDKDGFAVFNNVLISGSEGYVLSEENVPVKYEIPGEEKITVAWNEITGLEINNVLKRIASPVIKTDQKGNALPGAGLAVYTGDNELVFAGLTDEDGMLSGLELVVGKRYYVREFLAPAGYILDETVKVIDVLEDGTVEGDYSFVNVPEPTPVPTPLIIEEPAPEPTETPLPVASPSPEITETPKVTTSPAPTEPPAELPPETGDGNNIRLYVMLASVAVVIGVVILVVLKKREEDYVEE